MSLFPDLDPEPTPEPKRWTERMMLDLIHERHSIARGGNGPRYVVAEHVRNEAGFGGYDHASAIRGGKRSTLRTADAMAVDLWPSSGNLVHGFEVKVSRSDWLTELRDPTKADAFRRYCDPRLQREPMPPTFVASLLRATVRTAERRASR